MIDPSSVTNLHKITPKVGALTTGVLRRLASKEKLMPELWSRESDKRASNTAKTMATTFQLMS